MDGDLERLSYDASLRTLDKQEEVLNELRARTGLLLAASSLAASFLGRPALESAHGVPVAVALASFGVSVAASVYVLLPKSNLIFSLSGPALLEGLYDYRHDMPEVYRRIAYDLHRFWIQNDMTIQRLLWWYRVAAGSLVIEIVLLLASVSDILF